MIDKLKERATRNRVLATIIFGAIILVFALFTYQPPATQMGAAYAARVNRQIISIQEFREAVDRMTQIYGQFYGGGGELNPKMQQDIRKGAMNQLVTQEASVQAAEKSGIMVSDAEVADTILSVPVFQKDGAFQRDLYNTFLQNRRLNATQFEAQLRHEMAFRKVRELFQSSLTPPKIEVEKVMVLGKIQTNLEYLRFDFSQADSSKISKDEAMKYLATQEGEKEAKSYFDRHKSEFQKPEQMHARHILIKIDPSKPASEKAALEKINKIRDELKTKSFEELAKKYSEDVGSKIKGGDLGFFSRGRMVPEFESAAFELPIGKVSAPVKSSFGYHLIRVEEKKPAQVPDFEADKTGIAQSLLAQQKMAEDLDRLRKALAEKQISAVQDIAKKWSIKWQETGPFTLTTEQIPQLGSSDDFFKASIGLTKEVPLYSDIITQGAVHYVVRLKDRTEKAPDDEQKSFEATQTRVSSMRGREAFEQWVQNAIATSKIETNSQLLKTE